MHHDSIAVTLGPFFTAPLPVFVFIIFLSDPTLGLMRVPWLRFFCN